MFKSSRTFWGWAGDMYVIQHPGQLEASHHLQRHRAAAGHVVQVWRLRQARAFSPGAVQKCQSQDVSQLFELSSFPMLIRTRASDARSRTEVLSRTGLLKDCPRRHAKRWQKIDGDCMKWELRFCVDFPLMNFRSDLDCAIRAYK